MTYASAVLDAWNGGSRLELWEWETSGKTGKEELPKSKNTLSVGNGEQRKNKDISRRQPPLNQYRDIFSSQTCEAVDGTIRLAIADVCSFAIDSRFKSDDQL